MTLATLMLYPLIRAESRGAYKGQGRSRKDILLSFILAAVGIFPGQVPITLGHTPDAGQQRSAPDVDAAGEHRHPGDHFLHERITWMRWGRFLLAIVEVLISSGIDLRGLNFGMSYLSR
jgi:hypothetical protein